MDVRRLTDGDPVWDQIHLNRSFSIYHSRIWRDIIAATFKHTALYVAASEHGKLIDVLPFFLVKAPLIGKRLVSTPYEACHGGFSSPRVDARKMLIERVLEDARQWNVKYVEIRSQSPVDDLKEYGFIEQRPFVTSRIPLRSMDDNWQMLSAKHRRNVRIAQKKGVSVAPASSWHDMQAFHRILSDHYKRKLGVPFLGKEFFRQVWERLIAENNGACLLLARLDRQIIGGNLLFFSGRTLISKYSACNRNQELRTVNASYALFWEAIRLGIEGGFAALNLGITGRQNTGLLRFKSRFGARTQEVHFCYYSVSGKTPDYAKYYQSYSAVKEVWKRMPASLTSLLGQKINQWIC